ncbi:MAG: hypothetical protein PHF35_02315 [Candidatus Moranbacteria bacterium]|nr:hypothetical protein [Candidatus Moranbacteria bacterium]
MTFREIIRSLMSSDLYFQLPLRERHAMVVRHLVLYGPKTACYEARSKVAGDVGLKGDSHV